MSHTWFRIRVSHLTEEKRYLPYAKGNKLSLAPRPKNKQRVTLKLSGRGCHVLSVSILSYKRQRCLFFSASLPPFLRVYLLSEKWNKTIHIHDKLRINDHEIGIRVSIISQILKGSSVCSGWAIRYLRIQYLQDNSKRIIIHMEKRMPNKSGNPKIVQEMLGLNVIHFRVIKLAFLCK